MVSNFVRIRSIIVLFLVFDEIVPVRCAAKRNETKKDENDENPSDIAGKSNQDAQSGMKKTRPQSSWWAITAVLLCFAIFVVVALAIYFTRSLDGRSTRIRHVGNFHVHAQCHATRSPQRSSRETAVGVSSTTKRAAEEEEENEKEIAI